MQTLLTVEIMFRGSDLSSKGHVVLRAVDFLSERGMAALGIGVALGVLVGVLLPFRRRTAGRRGPSTPWRVWSQFSGRGISPEERADKRARQVATIVFFIGIAFVVVPALIHIGYAYENPFKARTTTKRVVSVAPMNRVTITTTTEEAPGSFVERGLASGGLLLLRLAIVAAAVFLAGAVIQRLYLAEFALKLGGFELPALRKTTAKSIRQVGDAITGVQSDLASLATDVARRLEQLESVAPPPGGGAGGGGGGDGDGDGDGDGGHADAPPQREQEGDQPGGRPS
jgi:hypothetical protein